MITKTVLLTRPRFGDGQTPFFKVRITLGGYIKMVEFIPGAMSSQEPLSEWMNRRGSQFGHSFADHCAFPLPAGTVPPRAW